MATTIQNGVTGYISNDPDELAGYMQPLLHDPKLAANLGQQARAYAQQRFNIHRFAKDWETCIGGMLHSAL
jgi:glycosyltransferase involved in cell wall biosynthesis